MARRLELKGLLQEQTIVMNLTFEDVIGESPMTDGQLVFNVLSAWAAGPLQDQAANFVWTEATMYDTNALPGTPGTVIPSSLLPMAGLGGTKPVSTQTAMLTNHKTAGGPPFRGRTYVAGMDIANLETDGKWNGDSVVRMNAFFNSLLPLVAAGGEQAQFVIVSRKSPDVPPGTTAPVVQTITSNIPASQRRRRIGVGS